MASYICSGHASSGQPGLLRRQAVRKSAAVVARFDGGEHDGQVRFDRVPGLVVDGPGLQVVLGHPEPLLDLEELVLGADHELPQLSLELLRRSDAAC
jgi:hypothetical protein